MAIWRGTGGPGDATTDAANEASVASTKASEAASSASAAASSATAAATSATNAATSESNASTSETNAASSATSASSSATSASTSATNAATSETNAAASYDSFDDRYLGAKSSAPTLDNDGDALLTGALYWNTTDSQLYVWDGSAWNEAAFSSSSGVSSFNTRTGAVTLSSTDVNTALGSDAVLDSDIGTTVQAYSSVLAATTASYTTAEETKLAGIETGADVTDTVNVTAAGALMDSEVINLAQVKAFSSADYATAAQGTLADSAVQPSDNISTLTNDAGYITASAAETNDLTAAVTWANVPDANITQSSVTQHEAALSITESQISDLGTYVTETSATGSAVLPSGTTAQRDGSPANGYLRFNSTLNKAEVYITAGGGWGQLVKAGDSLGDLDNTITNFISASSTATLTNKSGNISQWTNDSGYLLGTSTTGSAIIPVGTTAQRDASPSTGYFRFNTTDGAFEGYDGSAWGSIGSGGSSYTDSDVDTHLNTSSATTGQVLSWNGSDYAWITGSGGGVTSFNTRTGAVTLTSSDVNTALGSDAVLDSDIGSTVQAYSSVLQNTTASYTTAEETKLSGIETGATADQTGAEIKTAYEGESNTNAYTDAEKTKLAGIETGATADQTTITQELTAAVTLTAGDLCFLNGSGQMDKANSSTASSAESKGLLAISIDSPSASATGTFLMYGEYTTSGLTAGSIYYVGGTDGTITTTQPSTSGHTVRLAGYALSTTKLWFAPDQTYIELT
jgi:hypothetical protein